MNDTSIAFVRQKEKTQQRKKRPSRKKNNKKGGAVSAASLKRIAVMQEIRNKKRKGKAGSGYCQHSNLALNTPYLEQELHHMAEKSFKDESRVYFLSHERAFFLSISDNFTRFFYIRHFCQISLFAIKEVIGITRQLTKLIRKFFKEACGPEDNKKCFRHYNLQ